MHSMRSRSLHLVFGLLVAFALVASSCGGSGEESAVGTSESNPDLPSFYFTAPAVGGGQIDLGDLAGQDIVLWFWAPW